MKNVKSEMLWSHVHRLVMLASAGSFTSAAQRLGVSKAAMSQRIAALEQAAGVPLVRRTTRSVRLTEAGQQLVDATRGAFEQIEHGLANVKDLSHGPRGLLRITAPVALGRQQIVPLIPAFLKQCPEVRIELELADRLARSHKTGSTWRAGRCRHPRQLLGEQQRSLARGGPGQCRHCAAARLQRPA